MKKLLTIFVLLMFLCLNADAKIFKGNYKSIISDSGINPSSISISLKNVDTDKTVYSLNDKILIHPASVLKLLTIVPSMDVLGKDYSFKTELYERGKDSYVIKLGADPFFKSSDLEYLVSKIDSKKVQKIYIDDSVIERKDWGEGWQWDDDLNPSIQRFNAYNLDGNVSKITIMPTNSNQQALIINPQKSPITFFNNVITGEINDIRISRDNVTSANTLKLEGTVKTPQISTINNNNLKMYFEKKLTDALEDRGIYLKAAYSVTKVLPSDKLVADVSHPVSMAVSDILQNSSNMTAETLGKLAGGKYYNKQGTDTDGIKLFNEYCQKNGLDTSRIRVTDLSGVSKNNLLNADFITEFLVKNKDNKFYDNMAVPGTGTLSTRMIPLKNNLKAKTGTLSDISTIAGYLTAKSGQKYAFAIMINDPSTKDFQKKNLENYLIREMYYSR